MAYESHDGIFFVETPTKTPFKMSRLIEGFFLNFPMRTPKKTGKNEMNIRGIFLCLPVQQSPEKCTDK